MHIDDKFKDSFAGKIAQVFIYITDTCNLRCVQCLYKTELTFQLNRKEIPYSEAVALMSRLKELGADKITFMGGEPTLYRELPELIGKAKGLGYSYVRIDTNGTFHASLLDNAQFQLLDEVTFSIDGHSPETNDYLRGEGSFERCSKNIREAIAKGYNVQTTSCVHAELVKPNEKREGELHLISLVRYLMELGVKTINMHDLLKSGIPRDVWTGAVATTVEEYIYAFGQVQIFAAEHSDVSIRMPQCVVDKQTFASNPEYYGYCSVKQYDRILAFPNGMLRICSLMIGTPYCVAYYDHEGIYWNNSPTNELLGHQMNADTKCTNQGKGHHFKEEHFPLCVSFKPQQSEPVWNKHLHWEDRRNR